MLLGAASARGVADGTVTVAFRRWDRPPRVRAGSRFTTVAGIVEVTSVDVVDGVTDEEAAATGVAPAAFRRMLARPGTLYRIGLRFAGADPRVALREDAALGAADRAAIAARLDAMDRRRADGPWTRGILALIAAHPGRRAPDLAAELGRETRPFKADVRKLKELGLTRSLPVGYELSPRGRAFLSAGRTRRP